jgi:tRNA pseudouridine38-40 synthase
LRIALKIEYAGRRFAGSQFQSGQRTVQDELERALGIFLRAADGRVKCLFAGRTDSGVHARGQVVHFDVDSADLDKALQGLKRGPEAKEIAGLDPELDPGLDPELDPGAEANRDQSIPSPDLWRLCWGVNGILGNDMSVAAAQVVPDDFHARFSAIRRSYAYRILNRPQRSPLLVDTHWFIPFPLPVDELAALTGCLVGNHDFAGFKSTNADTLSTFCTVERAEILNLGEGELEFRISANHFVYNMVRIIVGTLVDIGLGKRCRSGLLEALEQRQRQKAGPTAPPWGLSLESIDYPETFQLFSSGDARGARLINKSGDRS